MPGWLRRNRTVVALLVVLVLLLANSVVMYRAIDSLIDAQAPVVSAFRVIRELDRLRTALLDAETGQRGYLLTSDTRYLDPYLVAVRAIERELRELDHMARGDARIADKVRQIDALVRDKLMEMEQTIGLRRAGGIDAALSVVETDRGQRTMNAIRALIGGLEEDEDRRVAISSEQARRGSVTTVATFFLASVLTFAVSAVALLVVWREMRERERTEGVLREGHARLEAGLKALAERNLQVGLVTEMSGVLQSCVNAGEAFVAVSRFCAQLFPGTSGALYVLQASRNHVELVETWGGQEAFTRLFSPSDCWAIRRSQPYVVARPALDLICKHAQDGSAYLCVPLQAQADTLGLLHIRLPAQSDGEQLTAVRRLAEATSRQIALALANIRLRETLHMQSVRDPLTGLFNRRYLEESLDREIARARRNKTPFSVVMIDIDHFKQVNDLYGHEAGDMVLREVGALLRRQVRGSDTACRFGGEEFTLLLSDASAADALPRCNRLREAIKQLALSHRQQVLGTISASMGIAEFPTHGESAEALTRAADLALYRAKREGRDRALIAATDDAQYAASAAG